MCVFIYLRVREWVRERLEGSYSAPLSLPFYKNPSQNGLGTSWTAPKGSAWTIQPRFPPVFMH